MCCLAGAAPTLLQGLYTMPPSLQASGLPQHSFRLGTGSSRRAHSPSRGREANHHSCAGAKFSMPGITFGKPLMVSADCPIAADAARDASFPTKR
jgi:hypothetical protein